MSKKVEETRDIALFRSMYISTSSTPINRLGLDHDCDGQTNRQTEGSLAIARSDIVRISRVFTKWVNLSVAIAIMVMAKL